MGAGECGFSRPEDIKWSKICKADLQKDFSDAHRFDMEHYMGGQEIIRAYLDGAGKCNLCFDFENRNKSGSLRCFFGTDWLFWGKHPLLVWFCRKKYGLSGMHCIKNQKNVYKRRFFCKYL